MKRAALLILTCGLLSATAAATQAACLPRPHGPYGGSCYACGGRGLARGYPQGYYAFGGWGYGQGYATGNYGYGSGFGTNPEYSPSPGRTSGYDGPGFSSGYYGPGYASGYATGRGKKYKVVAYYFGSGGYICRSACPRDYGGEYGGVLAPTSYVADGPAPQDAR